MIELVGGLVDADIGRLGRAAARRSSSSNGETEVEPQWWDAGCSRSPSRVSLCVFGYSSRLACLSWYQPLQSWVVQAPAAGELQCAFIGTLFAAHPVVDGVSFAGDHQPRRPMKPWGKMASNEAGVGVEQLDAQGTWPSPQQQVGAVEQVPMPMISRRPQYQQQHQGKPSPIAKPSISPPAEAGSWRHSLGAAYDDAVGDDEGRGRCRAPDRGHGVVRSSTAARWSPRSRDDHHVEPGYGCRGHPVAHQKESRG